MSKTDGKFLPVSAGKIENIYLIFTWFCRFLPVFFNFAFLALKTQFIRSRRLHKVVRGIQEWLNWKILEKSVLFYCRFYNSAGQNRIGRFGLLCHWVPGKIVDLIQWMYSNTRAQVLTPDGLTDIIRDIRRGVARGYSGTLPIYYCTWLLFTNNSGETPWYRIHTETSPK